MKSLFSVNDAKNSFKADYGQLFNFFKQNSKQEVIDCFELNRRMVRERVTDERPDFKGGYYNDMFDDVVIDTKKILDVKPQQSFVNKRKRFLSEHDGDYVHERRYDINFMESARREKVVGNNLIKINAVSGFRSDTDASDIDAYAKEICELVNYFESAGRSVELNLRYVKTGLVSGQGAINIDITVKRPDQYLSKSDIYRAFSALFHRIIGFATFIYAAEANGVIVDDGLGYSVAQRDRISVAPDEITIHGLTRDIVKKVHDRQTKSA